MEHFFAPILDGDLRSDAHQSQIIGGNADVDHTQIIGGDISPHPPRVLAPLVPKATKSIISAFFQSRICKKIKL